MVKFEIEEDDHNKSEPTFTKKVGDQLEEKTETTMNHTRKCPECGEIKVIIELMEMCVDCVNKTSMEVDNDTKETAVLTMTEEITEIEETEEEILDIKDVVAIYKKQYPKKKPVYQRGGESVESKHFQAWKKKYESELETVEEIAEMVENETVDKEIVQFLDTFCISAIEAEKYKGSIKTGKGINPEFLKWYLNNAKPNLTKHIDYKKMGVKNQRIVKEFLDIEDDNNQKDDKKSKETVKSEPIVKKSSKTLDKIDDHRRKSMKSFVNGLKKDGKEFDFSVLKDISMQTLKDNLQEIPPKELQMCFYLVMSQVEFLYTLMSEKMDFNIDNMPTDGQIESIGQIKNMLGK